MAESSVTATWRGRLVVSATSLFFVGALTGVLIPLAGSDDAQFHRVLASHLNALLGCFWLLGLAWTLPKLVLAESRLVLMCWLTALSCWANWGVTLVKAYAGVAALDWGGGGTNGVLWLALLVTVVLPTGVGSALWAWGAWRGRHGWSGSTVDQ